MNECIIIINGIHNHCVLLRQIDNYAIVCYQDRLIKVKVTFKSILNVIYVELIDDSILLDLALII